MFQNYPNFTDATLLKLNPKSKACIAKPINKTFFEGELKDQMFAFLTYSSTVYVCNDQSAKI